jgi:hypothetical protein
MKNPCKECLLVNNCTAVCEDKTNFQTLLKNALRNYGFGFQVRTNQDRALHRRWTKLKTENDLDMSRITGRAARLKSGADNI